MIGFCCVYSTTGIFSGSDGDEELFVVARILTTGFGTAGFTKGAYLTLFKGDGRNLGKAASF